MDKGFTQVRPLAGGFEAWIKAGYPVEDHEQSPEVGQKMATA
jgi:3-mercaptopyruvate sulfurtransferase SseA